MKRSKKASSPKTSSVWTKPPVIVATLALLGTIITALLSYLGSQGQTYAPISATQTAEAKNTQVASSSSATLASTPPLTPTSTPLPSMEFNCLGPQGVKVNVVIPWDASEDEEKFRRVLAFFIEACGYDINIVSTRDPAVLDNMMRSAPPDIVFWNSAEPLNLYTDQLQDLGELGANVSNYADYWADLGTVDGRWLAVPVQVGLKSLIWYSPARFDAFGYEVPTTFVELESLVEQMVADGNVPWSMGFESGAATGWAGSDFIQDLLLVQQGPDYINGIIAGDIAYDDEGVVQAYETYVKWASDPIYTVDGAMGTVDTLFLDAIYQVFSDSPRAMMVRQASFAGDAITERFPGLEFGTDFDFFRFPGAQGLQVGADFMMAISDSPATRALVTYLTSAEGANAWAKADLGLSPNKQALGRYTEEQLELAKQAEILASATGFTLDLNETLPGGFAGAEWNAVTEAIQGTDISIALSYAAAVAAELIP